MTKEDREKRAREIGMKIRAIRKQKNLTQKQLGERCGIAEPTIRRYELGKLNPKIETLQKIATALEVSLEDIFHFFNVEPGTYPLPIEGGMIGTLDWYARKNNRTIFDEVNIAVDFYLDDLAMLGKLSDKPEEENLDNEYDLDHKYYSVPISLLDNFSMLNEEGKEKALERIHELTEIPRYMKQQDE